MNYNAFFEKTLIVYFVISILIEILDLIFYYTDSKEDDKFIYAVQMYWDKISKVMLGLSIRTPITIGLQLIVGVLKVVIEFVKRK